MSQLVLRPVLIDNAAYPDHLRKLADWGHKRIYKTRIRDVAGVLRFEACEKLWMIEISVPDLFSTNKRKLGEVLLLAEADPGYTRDFSSFLLARLPGFFITITSLGARPLTPEFRFVDSGVEGHVQLYGCEETG